MAYSIRPAGIANMPHIVAHREKMFRDMGIPAEFEDMSPEDLQTLLVYLEGLK